MKKRVSLETSADVPESATVSLTRTDKAVSVPQNTKKQVTKKPKVSTKKSVPTAVLPVKKTVAKKRTSRVVNGHITAVGDTDTVAQVKIRRGASASRKSSQSEPAHEVIYTYFSHVDHAAAAHNVARYAGTFFVTVGAILTLFHFNTLVSVIAQSESAQDVTQGAVGACGIDGVPCENSPAPQPDIDIRIENTNGVVSKSVPITVTTQGALRVTAVAYQLDTNTYKEIGVFQSVNNSVWTTMWDTEKFDDGVYQIKVTVHTSSQAYTKVAPQNITVQNEHAEDGTEIHEDDTDEELTPPNDTDPNTGTTTDEMSEEEEISEEELVLDEAPRLVFKDKTIVSAPGIILLQLEGDDAQSVRMQIRANAGGEPQYGYASYRNALWVYEWNAELMPLDTYKVKAEARSASGALSTAEATVTLVASTSRAEEEIDEIESDPVDGLDPEVTLEIPQKNNITGTIDVFVKVQDAQFVELYAIPNNSLTPRFVGLLGEKITGEWRLSWDTTETPSGSYALYANVRHAFGDTKSDSVPITLLHTVKYIPTDDEQVHVENLEAIYREIDTDNTEESEEALQENDSEVSPETVSEEGAVANTPLPLSEFRQFIKGALLEFAHAIRTGDATEIEKSLVLLNQIALTFVDTEGSAHGLTRDDIEDIRVLEETVVSERDRIQRKEELLRERAGEALSKDTDADTISDYDEINIYKTNPFISDTDADGIPDGIEILGGFDPLSAVSDVLVKYESPRESIVPPSPELLVESIAGLDTVETERERAIITGKGLPLSFVTLHIFSTPVIVTVKTDASGSWEYIFDKELEDGSHEIYATLTDNTGAIVAKSNPFTFVKTAEAYAPLGTEKSESLLVTPEAPTLFSPSIMLAIASLSVVSLGLVLILLGLHVDRQRKPVTYESVPQTS